jgi:hypothetical protein
MSTLTLTPAVTVAQLSYTPADLPDALLEAELLRSQAQNAISKREEDSIIKEAQSVGRKISALRLLLRQHAHAGNFVMNLVYPEAPQQCDGVQSVISSVYHIILSRRDANAHTLVVPERDGYQRMAWEHHQMMNPNRVD